MPAGKQRGAGLTLSRGHRLRLHAISSSSAGTSPAELTPVSHARAAHCRGAMVILAIGSARARQAAVDVAGRGKMLIERIKTDRLAAMKSRDELRKNLLSTLVRGGDQGQQGAGRCERSPRRSARS